MAYIGKYIDATSVFSTVRKAEAGKPLSRSYRLFKEASGAFTIKHHGGDVCRIYPDNTLEMLVDSYMPNSIDEILPIFVARIGTARYRINHRLKTPMTHGRNVEYPDRVHMTQVAPELFNGIKFNMITGDILNYRADLQTRIIPEQRKLWRQGLTAIQRKIVAMARVGVFDELAKGVVPWPHVVARDEYNKLLAAAIKSGDVDNPNLLKEMTRRAKQRGRWNNTMPFHKHIRAQLQSDIDSNRTELRKHFGVYSD